MRACLFGLGLLGLGLLGLNVGPALAAPVPAARVVEPAGGFSYVPPPGWHVKSFPGLKYKMCYAPPASGYSPNLIVSEDRSAQSLDVYQQASNAGLRQSYANVHIISQTPFVTSAGLQGLRIAVVGVPTKLHLAQIFYLFPASSTRKLIVLVSWLSADGNKYAAAADTAMKTLKLQ